MRITIVMGFFLPVPPVRGGSTEKIWFRLARHFADAGHQVTLVSRTWENWPREETDRGLTLLRLPGRDHTRRLASNLALDLWWSLRVLRHLPPGDILVSNNVTLPIFARRLRPVVGRVAVVLGRMPKGQVRTYGAVDRLLATSQAVAARARLENPSVAPRLTIFPNPIDWPLHQAARAQLEPGHRLTLGFVGRIHPEKGLEQLLAACELLLEHRNLPAWHCRIIGPSDVALGGGGREYLERLRAGVSPALRPHLDFLPAIFDPAVLARHYGEMDLFCYPTLAEKGEGLSIAPIEAMAAGAVPVLSRLDCYRDLLRPDGNGLDFDHRGARPAAELAGLLAGLLADSARRQRLSAAAQETARHYDYHTSAQRLLADFAQLTGSPAPASSAP